MNLQTLIPLLLKASVFLSVFAIGLSSGANDARYLFRRPRELMRALLAMNILMPALAIAMALWLDLAPELKIALVLLAVSPIPPLLPGKMTKAGSSGSYALGLLIAISLLSIIFVPLAMKIIARIFDLPLGMSLVSVASLVFVTVLLPVGLGMLARRALPALASRLAEPIKKIAGIALLACVVVIVIAGARVLGVVANSGALVAIAAFVVFGLVAGHVLGGPASENRAALALSSATRHPGVAIAIAQANFPEQKLATAAILLYLLVCAVVTIPYLAWNKRRQRA